jgi:hypothetical protein
MHIFGNWWPVDLIEEGLSKLTGLLNLATIEKDLV